MNVETFEREIGDRILKPKNVMLLSLSFQKEYSPEDMIRWMTAGSNSIYHIDKQSYKPNIFKYSVNTLNEGFVYTLVPETEIQPTGDKMEKTIVQQISELFDTHPKERDFFKFAVVSGLGFFVANSSQIVSFFPYEWQPFLAPIVAGGLGWLAAHVNLNTKWPIVGSK